ncbi:MAG: hypothetical protein FJ147_03050 [Deltaproteobacteria bacterium]|nr:hypothetical protein [Deltaproteobacteria bacterium]
MSPLFMQILLYLSSAFALGALVGWLTKQLLANQESQRTDKIWENRLHDKQQEVENAQQEVRDHEDQLQSLEEQLHAARARVEERSISLAALTRDFGAKTSELASLTSHVRTLREKEAKSTAALSEERQLSQRLEHEVQSLRRDLADKTEAQLQISRQLQDQERQGKLIRELEASHKTQRTRFETIIRTKDIELQQLQQRFSALEAQLARLTESNGKLRHSCAHYQRTLNEKETAIVQLQNRVHEFEPPATPPISQTPEPDVRMHMDTRDKDSEISRLRARIAGLQLLLRRGPARLRPVAPQALVDITKSDTR